MTDQDLCDQFTPLMPGASWPSDDADAHVGPFRQAVQSVDELERIENELIAFPVGNENARRTTSLIRHRLETLAVRVSEHWGAARKLRVRDCYIPDVDSRHDRVAELHREARIAKLEVEPGGTTPEEELQILQKLACLCQESGLEFIQYITGANTFIRAAVPRDDYLFGLHVKVSVSTARSQLSEGWLRFTNRPNFDPRTGNPRVLIDGPDVALKPIPFDDYDQSRVQIGKILLSAASHRGLSPKAYFLDSQSRVQNQPIIRLIPSPVADLSTLLIPVSIDSLELSLRRYSDDGLEFNGDDRPLNAVIDELTEDPAGRYHGIELRLHDVLKPQIVTTVQPADSSLTRILDALALEVHGSWHWVRQNRIDFISRPYNEYVGQF